MSFLDRYFLVSFFFFLLPESNSYSGFNAPPADWTPPASMPAPAERPPRRPLPIAAAADASSGVSVGAATDPLLDFYERTETLPASETAPFFFDDIFKID
jgi:hypothetical protein